MLGFKGAGYANHPIMYPTHYIFYRVHMKKKQSYFTCTIEDLLLTGVRVGCFVREIWIVGQPSLKVYPPWLSQAFVHIIQSRMSYFI